MTIVLALIFSVRYFYWRAVATFNPAAKWFFYIFIAAEILNFLEAALFYFTAWNPTHHRGPKPLLGRTVDIFITTCNEPVDLLRETVVCAVSVRYPHKTYILDDGNRPQVAGLAGEFQCEYIAREHNRDAKAGNLNNALASTTGEFIVVLDADHVPAPELIDELIGFFANPQVAVVQATQDFYNLDSFQHRLNRPKHFGWQQQELFFSVIQPGKDRYNAAFYCGSPAMLRREALEDVGGFATGTITEDMHTSLRLQKRGWKTIYHNRTVARGLAPQTFVGFATQWHRWGYGAMQVLRAENPLFGGGLKFAQRICYFASFYFYWMSYQKLIYVLTPIFCLLSGIFPLIAEPGVFFRYFAPYLLLNTMASCRLQGGCRNFFLSEQFNLLKIQVLLKTIVGLVKAKARFVLTPKSRAAAARCSDMSLPLLVTGGLLAALVIGSLHLLPHPSGFRFWALVVNLFWAAFYVALLVPAVWRALHRAERRASYRFPTPLMPAVSISYEDATRRYHCADASGRTLNRSGLSLTTIAPIPVGTFVEMELELEHRRIRAGGRVKRNATYRYDTGTGISNGIQFERIDAADQDEISKYLFWRVAPAEDALLRLTQASRREEP